MQKVYKILFTLFVLLLIILIFAVRKIDTMLEVGVKRQLDSLIARTDTTSLYQLRYKDVVFHVWDGSVEITGVKIIPDAGLIDSLKKGVLRSYIEASFKSVSVEGVSYKTFYKTRKLLIDDLIISEPALKITYNPEVEKVKRKAFEPGKLLSKDFRSAEIKNIQFLNLNFSINNIKRKNPILDIDSLNLRLGNVVFDSLSILKKVPVLFSKTFLSVHKIAVNISEYYMLKTDNFTLNSEKDLIEIDSIRLIPKYNQKEFDRKITYEKSWLKVNVGTFRIEGFNVDSIREKQKIYLKKIYVERPEIITYKNKQLKDPPFKYEKLLSQVIREIPVPIKVDTVIAKNGFIRVQNIGDKVPQTQAANIDFRSAYIKISGITNDSVFIEKRPTIKIAFYSRFMGKADLNATINMPVFHPKNYFSVKAKMGKLEGAALNDLLNRLLLLNIKSGTILSTEIEFVADNDSAYGYVDLSYQNLKLDMKSTDNPQKSVVFVNALLNTVAKNNNIKDHHGFTRGFIAYKRLPNDKFFRYLWKAIQTGIVNTLLPAKEVKGQSKQFKKSNKKDAKQVKKSNKEKKGLFKKKKN